MITPHTVKMKEVIEVAIPTVIGDILADLDNRGVSRETIATALGVKLPTVSMLRHGKTSLANNKLTILAAMHGGYTGEDLIALKYIEWLEREKGVTRSMIERALHPERRADKAA